jgi:hypothetical protein
MNPTESPVAAAPPPYAAPVTPPTAQPEEPAKLNALERLWGTLFSPGETFRDVNRKPTILVPLVLGAVLALGGGVFFNWKVKPDWDRIFTQQLKKRAEKSGQTLTQDQIDQQVGISKKFVNFFPIVGAVFTPVTYLIIAGIMALGLMLLQAKTTFKKILSVVSWSYMVTALVQLIVLIAVIMVQDQETLNQIDPTKGLHIVPESLASFLPADASPVMTAAASWVDVFSIWYLIILSIGLAAVAGSKKITASKTGVLVFGLWFVAAGIGIAWRAFFGS